MLTIVIVITCVKPTYISTRGKLILLIGKFNRQGALGLSTLTICCGADIRAVCQYYVLLLVAIEHIRSLCQSS